MGAEISSAVADDWIRNDCASAIDANSTPYLQQFLCSAAIYKKANSPGSANPNWFRLQFHDQKYVLKIIPKNVNRTFVVPIMPPDTADSDENISLSDYLDELWMAHEQRITPSFNSGWNISKSGGRSRVKTAEAPSLTPHNRKLAYPHLLSNSPQSQPILTSNNSFYLQSLLEVLYTESPQQSDSDEASTSTTANLDEDDDGGGDHLLHQDLHSIHANLIKINHFIEGIQAYYILVPHYSRSLASLLRFNPSSVSSDDACLFLLYQICSLLAFLHERNIIHGDLKPSNCILTGNHWVCISDLACPSIRHQPQISMNDTRESMLMQWVTGKISNFDYLMELNRLAGRERGMDPADTPILPWIVDFTSPDGGWRDLTKSKFRLKKGDDQLDFTYNSSSDPHHITELFSDITYYVYMSRITPVSTLKRIVRDRFVANEYPPSMARIFTWTPDECIPEFFIDSQVFGSEHKDLGLMDLQVPEWFDGDVLKFLQWHKQMLESDHVSHSLHHWIDITFGYKLSGQAAIDAKNVPLHSTKHSSRRSAFVQLFDRPHPKRVLSKFKAATESSRQRFTAFSNHHSSISTDYQAMNGDPAPPLSSTSLHSNDAMQANISAQVNTNLLESDSENTNSLSDLLAYQTANMFDTHFRTLEGCYSPIYTTPSHQQRDHDDDEWTPMEREHALPIPTRKLAELKAGDMFSLGCIWAELFGKRPMFSTHTHQLYANGQYEYDISHLPSFTKSIVSSLLSRDVSNRPTAVQLLNHPIFRVRTNPNSHAKLPVYRNIYDFTGELRRQMATLPYSTATTVLPVSSRATSPMLITVPSTVDIHTPPAKSSPVLVAAEFSSFTNDSINGPSSLPVLPSQSAINVSNELEIDFNDNVGGSSDLDLPGDDIEKILDDENDNLDFQYSPDLDSSALPRTDASGSPSNYVKDRSDLPNDNSSNIQQTMSSKLGAAASMPRAQATLDWVIEQLQQLSTIPPSIYALIVPHVIRLCSFADIELPSLDLFDVLGKKLGRALSGVHLAPPLQQLLLHVDHVDLQCDLVNILFLRMVRQRFGYLDFFRSYLAYVRNSLLSSDWRVSEMSAATLYTFVTVDLELRHDLDQEIAIRDIILPMFGRLGRTGSDQILLHLVNIASEVSLSFLGNVYLPTTLLLIEKGTGPLQGSSKNELDIKLACGLDLAYALLPDLSYSTLQVLASESSPLRPLFGGQTQRGSLSHTCHRKFLRVVVLLMYELTTETRLAESDADTIASKQSASGSTSNLVKKTRSLSPLFTPISEHLHQLQLRSQTVSSSNEQVDKRTYYEFIHAVYSALMVLLEPSVVRKSILGSFDIEKLLMNAPTLSASGLNSSSSRRFSVDVLDPFNAPLVDRAHKHSEATRARRNQFSYREEVRESERRKIKAVEKSADRGSYEENAPNDVDKVEHTEVGSGEGRTEGLSESDDDDEEEEIEKPTAQGNTMNRRDKSDAASIISPDTNNHPRARKSIFSWLSPASTASTSGPSLTFDLSDHNSWSLNPTNVSLAKSLSPNSPSVQHNGDDLTNKLGSKYKGEVKHVIRAHKSAINSIDSHPFLGMFVTGGEDRAAKIWTVGFGNSGVHASISYLGHKQSINCVKFLRTDHTTMPDKVASSDTIVHIWDTITGQTIHTTAGFSSASGTKPVSSGKNDPQQVVITCFDYLPFRHSLVLGTALGTLRLHDIRMNQGYGPWRQLGVSQPSSAVRCIASHPTCRWIATGLASGELTILDERSGVIRSQWRAHETSVLQVMPIGEQQLLSSGSDKSICIWDIGGMEPVIIQRFSAFDENAKSIISHYPGEITCGVGSRIAFGELNTTAPLEKRYSSRLTIVPLKSHKSRSPISAISILQSYKLLLLGTEDGKLLLSV